MSRKKTKKTAAKRKVETNTTVSLLQLEKALLQAPVALINELTKQVSVLKRKDAQLKSDLSKATKEVAAVTKQVKAAQKAKLTAAGKKQLLKAKKALAEANKVHVALVKMAKDAAKAFEATSAKLAKAVELRKYLNQFDAIWSKKSKATAKKRPAKVKAKAKVTSNTVKASTHDVARDEFEQPAMMDYNAPAAEVVEMDEAVKSSS